MRSCLEPSRYDGGAHALAGREEAAPPSALAYAACASSRDLSVHGALPPIARPSPPRRTAETVNVALARGRHSPTPRCALSTRPSAVHTPLFAPALPVEKHTPKPLAYWVCRALARHPLEFRRGPGRLSACLALGPGTLE